MRDGYRQWLEVQEYRSEVISSRISNINRIEQHYGDLEQRFKVNSLSAVSNDLVYTKDDERRNRPNRSRVPIDGSVYNGLATLRAALNLYKKFLEATSHNK